MPRIAVVDTDPELQWLMHELFALEGWDILPVTGEYVCEMVIREAPDLVIVETWLQDPESGWHILEKIRSNPRTRAIPLIAWTSDVTRLQERRDWLLERDIAVLTKPFDIDDVYQAIETALQRA